MKIKPEHAKIVELDIPHYFFGKKSIVDLRNEEKDDIYLSLERKGGKRIVVLHNGKDDFQLFIKYEVDGIFWDKDDNKLREKACLRGELTKRILLP